jgi:gamma-glutamyltranspeptidase/glutathione hydrolase
VYARLARGYAERREVMERYPGTRAVYLRNGQPPKEGDLFRQPELAATLERLAAAASTASIAAPPQSACWPGSRRPAGKWTAEELAAYRVRNASRSAFPVRRHWEVVTAPPPSSGGVALAQMLQILKAWDLASLKARSAPTW